MSNPACAFHTRNQVKSGQNRPTFLILKIEKKCSLFTYRPLPQPQNSILQLKLKKNGFSIFSKIAKKTKFCVILLFFVHARSQSSVGVGSSRGTQNARNKPIYDPCQCGFPKPTFQPVFEAIRQNEILKFLEKSVFFNEENTNEFDPMVKSGKIHFFSI